MNKRINDLFTGTDGAGVYKKIVAYITRQQIDKLIDKGVLLGLSGGADSVFLLSFLLYYRELKKLTFPIVCCHVNHGIRGEEAKRDAEFSANLSSDLGVEFLLREIDVPSLAKQMSQGLEETARNARYSLFNDIIRSRNDISTISVAHNATDNSETVIFNLARGSSINGISGIKPVRDNIVRPILCIPKDVIVSLLDKYEIPYVTDSTNADCDYKRNFIRHKILPLLSELNPSYTDAISRMSENLQLDSTYINSVAEEEYHRILSNGRIKRESLTTLHTSIASRVLIIFARECAESQLLSTHVSDILNLLQSDNFSYSISGEYCFVCERGVCYFSKKEKQEKVEFFQHLSPGYNSLTGYACDIYIGRASEFSSNIYKFSIQTNISSAIIENDMFLRFRKNGDSYKYGNITHKLKKVFNDRDIPPSARDFIPIICDSNGIVWVPGLSVRDGLLDKKSEYIIALGIKEPNSTDAQIFYVK